MGIQGIGAILTRSNCLKLQGVVTYEPILMACISKGVATFELVLIYWVSMVCLLSNPIYGLVIQGVLAWDPVLMAWVTRVFFLSNPI